MFVQKRLANGTTIDSLAGRVPLLDPSGSGILSANQISSLTSYNSRIYDINLTLIGDNNFKFQPLEYIVSQEFTGYQIALPPLSRDLMMPGLFSQPEGSALDNSGNFFIADAGRDTVYMFNSFGDRLQTIGGRDGQILNQPYGVAFFNKTVYVADAGSNRILRFILSTEL
jgi:DNA-binding beta-propeller fold protein YncE